MKRIAVFLVVLIAITAVNAQKFVRYYMKDGSFNGFYTSEKTIIKHDSNALPPTISINGIEYAVAAENVDRIVFESANISSEFVGDYRIYEKPNPTGIFKRVIIDNRGMLLASKNGDFGINDIILAVSEYNNEKILFYTDATGRIKQFFTAGNLYYFSYSDDRFDSIVEFTGDGKTIDHSALASSANSRIPTTLYAEGSHDYIRIFEDIQRLQDLMESMIDNPLATIKNIVQNYTELANDPELHNQFLIVDGAILARDFASFVAATAAVIGSDGGSWNDFLDSIDALYGSIDELVNDMFPDFELIERFKTFYQNKYGINIAARPPADVTASAANLKGSFSSTKGKQGELKFQLHQLLDSSPWQQIIAETTQTDSSQSLSLDASVNQLRPSTEYVYYAEYECEVDGLKLVFSSDPVAFTTLTPEAVTVRLISNTSNSANIECAFRNIPQGAVWGLQYGTDGYSNVVKSQSSETNQIITINGLKSNTVYQYRAFIQYDNENYYGDMFQFSTEPVSTTEINVTTGSCIDISENSAIIECTYQGPEDATFGVEYWKQYTTDKKRLYVPHVQGKQTISIDGLSSSTSYYYRAFVEYEDICKYGGLAIFQTGASWIDLYCRYWYYSLNDSYPVLSLSSDGSALFWEIGSTSYDYESTWSYDESTFKTSYYVPQSHVTITYEGNIDIIEEDHGDYELYYYYKLSGTKTYLYNDGTVSSEPFVLYSNP